MSTLFICKSGLSGLTMNIKITWQHQVKFNNSVTTHKKPDYQLQGSDSLILRLITLQRGLSALYHFNL